MSATRSDYREVVCPQCGCAFALTLTFFNARVADRRAVGCPNGHGLQLGVPSRVDQALTSLTTALREARTTVVALQADRTHLLDANLRLVDENDRLRRTVVDAMLGPGAPEGGQG